MELFDHATAVRVGYPVSKDKLLKSLEPVLYVLVAKKTILALDESLVLLHLGLILIGTLLLLLALTLIVVFLLFDLVIPINLIVFHGAKALR